MLHWAVCTVHTMHLHMAPQALHAVHCVHSRPFGGTDAITIGFQWSRHKIEVLDGTLNSFEIIHFTLSFQSQNAFPFFVYVLKALQGKRQANNAVLTTPIGSQLFFRKAFFTHC